MSLCGRCAVLRSQVRTPWQHSAVMADIRERMNSNLSLIISFRLLLNALTFYIPEITIRMGPISGKEGNTYDEREDALFSHDDRQHAHHGFWNLFFQIHEQLYFRRYYRSCSSCCKDGLHLRQR